MKKEEKSGVSSGKVLRMAMQERGLTQVDLADKMGMKQPSISGNINRKRMGLDVFMSILDCMEYDVMIVDRQTGELMWKVDNGK